jgi:hypothetical protein
MPVMRAVRLHTAPADRLDSNGSGRSMCCARRAERRLRMFVFVGQLPPKRRKPHHFRFWRGRGRLEPFIHSLPLVREQNSHRGILPEDRAELVRLVTARTGLAQPEAERRVDDVTARAKENIARAGQAGVILALAPGPPRHLIEMSDIHGPQSGPGATLERFTLH